MHAEKFLVKHPRIVVLVWHVLHTHKFTLRYAGILHECVTFSAVNILVLRISKIQPTINRLISFHDAVSYPENEINEESMQSHAGSKFVGTHTIF